MAKWMIYGAYGYTGVLIAEEAVKHGHQPILAGRNAEKLRQLGERLNLAYVAFELTDTATLEAEVDKVDLVLLVAGPFVFTAKPMQDACLKTKTHYLDIMGEVDVMETTLQRDAEAKQAGILMGVGVGYDVVPTDCLANLVHQQLPDATHLEIGLGMGGKMQASAGTLKVGVEGIQHGTRVRRNGQIQRAVGTKQIPFRKSKRLGMIIPWGDLATAYHSTHIPNITVYMTLQPLVIRFYQIFAPLLWQLFKVKAVRSALSRLIDRRFKERSGSDKDGQTEIWVKVTNAQGVSKEAWLETPGAYHLTAVCAVRVVEKVLAEPQVGVFTPAQLLGADFILGMEGIELVGL